MRECLDLVWVMEGNVLRKCSASSNPAQTFKMVETGLGTPSSNKRGRSELESSNTQDGGKASGTREDGKGLPFGTCLLLNP